MTLKRNKRGLTEQNSVCRGRSARVYLNQASLHRSVIRRICQRHAEDDTNPIASVWYKNPRYGIDSVHPSDSTMTACAVSSMRTKPQRANAENEQLKRTYPYGYHARRRQRTAKFPSDFQQAKIKRSMQALDHYYKIIVETRPDTSLPVSILAVRNADICKLYSVPSGLSSINDINLYSAM